MCGIAGIASFDGGRQPTEAQLRAMCETIVHRGPDEDGYYLAQGAGLGGASSFYHRPLEGGHQPIFNEARTI